MAHAAHDLGVVFFDFHTAAAAVAALPAHEVRFDIGFGKAQTGWQAFDHHREALAVALSGREETELAHAYSRPRSSEAANSAAASSAGRGGLPTTGGNSIASGWPFGARS